MGLKPVFTAGRLRTAVFMLGLAACALAVFGQGLGQEFVNWDDFSYILKDKHVAQGLGREGVKWAFTTFDQANWHPLTWLSHMLDVELFGLNPGAHKMVALGLHLANSFLVFGLLAWLTRRFWPPALAAVLFALHPLHVESVAWLSERKDLLSTLFGLGGIWLFAAYARMAGKRRFWLYGLALAAYAASLMAKPMLVTLPFLLLLLDYWPLERWPRAQGNNICAGLGLVLEKAPFFVFMAGSIVMTIAAQGSRGAIASLEWYPLSARLANAAAAYGQYLAKTFWPLGLSAFYPHPKTVLWAPAIASLAVLALVTGLALAGARSRRYLLTGWLWFLGALVPVIGLVQVGSQAMADRYSYVPLIGVFIMLAWAADDLAARWVPRRREIALTALALALAAVLTPLAHTQAGYWKNTFVLFSHAQKVTRGNAFALSMMAGEWLRDKQPHKALPLLEKALAHDPAHIKANTDMGRALIELDRPREARQYLARALAADNAFEPAITAMGTALLKIQENNREALEYLTETVKTRPHLPQAQMDLGVALAQAGRPAEALVHYQKARELNPEEPRILYNMANLYMKMERVEEAAKLYQKAVELDGEDKLIRYNLGLAWLRLGRLKEAAAQFREAIRIDPAYARAVNNLASVHKRQGDHEAAAREFGRAVKMEPDYVLARYNLAGELFRLGRLEEALAQYQEVVRRQPENAAAHSNLGVTLFRLGRTREAVAQFEKALAYDPGFAPARAHLKRAREEGP